MSVQTMLPINRLRRTNFSDDSPTVLRQPRQAVPVAVPVPGIARDIRVKIASTRGEWEQAFQLVADNYQSRGYDASDCDCRFTSYHALPDSAVLVAKAGGVVAATLSLFPDNSLLGLPCEGLYKAEIHELRRAGHRLFEGGALADRDLGLREGLQVVLALIRLAWHCQLARGATMNVITVNPRHRDYYMKLYGYIPLGSRRSYAAVQGHPAEAFYLSPELMRARSPKMYREIFGVPLPRRALEASPMPASLVRHFARHSSQADPRLVEEILTYVQTYGSPRRW